MVRGPSWASSFVARHVPPGAGGDCSVTIAQNEIDRPDATTGLAQIARKHHLVRRADRAAAYRWLCWRCEMIAPSGPGLSDGSSLHTVDRGRGCGGCRYRRSGCRRAAVAACCGRWIGRYTGSGHVRRGDVPAGPVRWGSVSRVRNTAADELVYWRAACRSGKTLTGGTTFSLLRIVDGGWASRPASYVYRLHRSDYRSSGPVDLHARVIENAGQFTGPISATGVFRLSAVLYHHRTKIDSCVTGAVKWEAGTIASGASSPLIVPQQLAGRRLDVRRVGGEGVAMGPFERPLAPLARAEHGCVRDHRAATAGVVPAI